MRKIEVGEYNCPICNADIYPIANDFYTVDAGEETRTTWECQGCAEKFCTIEKAHVTPEKFKPKFNCRFCGQECAHLALCNDWTDYWKCLPCKVSYEERYTPNRIDVKTINMYAVINGHLYAMRQFMDRNKTRIEMLPENLDDTVVIAHEFPFLLPSVNPTNIQNKLLTYLIFS